MAQRYGVLPSDISDLDLEKYQLNQLIASVGIEQDVKNQKKIMSRKGKR